MPIDERRRLELHEVAKGIWGAHVAATFLEMLPPAGWGDVATHQQLVALEERMGARVDAVEDRLSVRIELSEERLRRELNAALLRMQRSMVGSILAASGAVIAAVAVLTR